MSLLSLKNNPLAGLAAVEIEAAFAQHDCDLVVVQEGTRRWELRDEFGNRVGVLFDSPTARRILAALSGGF